MRGSCSCEQKETPLKLHQYIDMSLKRCYSVWHNAVRSIIFPTSSQEKNYLIFTSHTDMYAGHLC